MKAKLLCAAGLLALASPHAMGASELEELRDRCARQEQEIRDLRARLASVQPAADPAAAGAVESEPAPTTEPAPAVAAEESIPVARPVDEAALAAASGKTHTVVSGDTFTRIATQHGVSLKALMAANPTVKATALKLGQKIVVPAAPAPAPATSGAVPEAGATADPGDAAGAVTTGRAQGIQQQQAEPKEKIITVITTEEMSFGEFAEKYGTDVQRLNSLNMLDLAPTSNLAKGSDLMVPEPKP
jgi:LysM repeat protein